MYLQVDIYICDDQHIHLVLRGQAEGACVFNDFDTFARFIEACGEFVKSNAPIPQAFLDAFRDEGNQ